MSTTRRELKHKRNKRRAETDQLRTARRDALSILLSRAQRGVLSGEDAALLRVHVEAELADGDHARASERGQQRAMERHRQRVEAADAAIVEAEQRAEEAEQRLARIRDMADAWNHRLPAVIRTATAADAVRLAADGDDRPVMFAVTNEQAADVAPGVAVIHDRAAEERADRAEQQLAKAHRRGDIWKAKAQEIEADRDRLAARAGDAERRAAQAEELQRIAHETSNAAERARADAEQRAEDAERRHDEARAEQQHVEAADTAALNLASSTIRQWKNRAQEAEEQATQQRNRATMWRAKAIETDDRADRYRAAWQSARQGRAEQRTLADARQDRLRIRARRITEWEQRAEEAERTATAWEHSARRYAANLDAERDRAEQAEAERDRTRDQRNTWARQADAEILDHRQRAEQAEHRAGRYRLAWHAARRDRRADRAAMAAELPTVQALARVRAARNRMAHGRNVDAIWCLDLLDEALAEPEPCQHTPGSDSECPCPPVCGCCAVTLAEPEPVTLATECAGPECEHPLNWHTGTPGGVCVARGGACPCSRFEPPTSDQEPTR